MYKRVQDCGMYCKADIHDIGKNIVKVILGKLRLNDRPRRDVGYQKCGDTVVRENVKLVEALMTTTHCLQ